jgi:hypothetical protein
MPGFVSFKTFRADDGERVSNIEFESEEMLQSSREHSKSFERSGVLLPFLSGLWRALP